MENPEDYKTELKKSLTQGERNEIAGFLSSCSLTLDEDIEETVLIRDSSGIAAAGSISGSVLKCIAVKGESRGENLSGLLLGELIRREYELGRTDLFIFTKPENRRVFEGLGFYMIFEVPDEALLMENSPGGLERYVETVRKETAEKLSGMRQGAAEEDADGVSDREVSAIVVNCNPFTKGHLYLIEKAAGESSILHVFVVSEDRSLFPSEVRLELVRKGTEHLANVVVHRGGSYIISNSTFPTYFIKDSRKINDIHAKMDTGIFASRIAPPLGIKKRFAGEEPLCPVTANYNRFMAEVLPSYGVSFTVIKRLELGGDPVSASRVRALIREGALEKVREIVPVSTYEFLKSEEGRKVIERIRGKAL